MTTKIIENSIPEVLSKRPKAKTWVIRANQMSYWLCQHWMATFTLAYGLFVLLPFLAPVFMQAGLNFPGRAIYTLYSFLCHQLAERSFFLFGPKVMYSLHELQSAQIDSTNLMALRAFIGNAQLGWKVAWSDRMVAMFGGIWIVSWMWWPLRRRLRPLPWWGLALLLLPLAIDGTTHFISDLWGLGQGFRDSNAWLVGITQNSLPASFYAGDALGSFNSLMRLWTGLLFAVGIVFFGFPYFYLYFYDIGAYLKVKYQQSGISL